jgi:hypothetical protein
VKVGEERRSMEARSENQKGNRGDNTYKVSHHKTENSGNCQYHIHGVKNVSH